MVNKRKLILLIVLLSIFVFGTGFVILCQIKTLSRSMVSKLASGLVAILARKLLRPVRREDRFFPSDQKFRHPYYQIPE